MVRMFGASFLERLFVGWRCAGGRPSARSWYGSKEIRSVAVLLAGLVGVRGALIFGRDAREFDAFSGSPSWMLTERSLEIQG